MKVFSSNIQDLRTLYISNLKKALDMEQKILKALPDMIVRLPIPNSQQRSRRTSTKPTGMCRGSRIYYAAASAKVKQRLAR